MKEGRKVKTKNEGREKNEVMEKLRKANEKMKEGHRELWEEGRKRNKN